MRRGTAIEKSRTACGKSIRVLTRKRWFWRGVAFVKCGAVQRRRSRRHGRQCGGCHEHAKQRQLAPDWEARTFDPALFMAARRRSKGNRQKRAGVDNHPLALTIHKFAVHGTTRLLLALTITSPHNRRSGNSIRRCQGSIDFAWNAADPDFFGNARGILETLLLCEFFGPERFRQDHKVTTSVLKQNPSHFHNRLIPRAVSAIGTR